MTEFQTQIVDDRILNELVTKIVEAVKPKRIILFGSASREGRELYHAGG